MAVGVNGEIGADHKLHYNPCAEKKSAGCIVRTSINSVSGLAIIIAGLSVPVLGGLALGGIIAPNVFGIALMGIGGGSLLLVVINSLSADKCIKRIGSLIIGLLAVIWFTTLGALAFTGVLSVTVVSWMAMAPLILGVGVGVAITCAGCCCGPCICIAVAAKTQNGDGWVESRATGK